MIDAAIDRAFRRSKQMKKPGLMEMPILDESQPRNVHRADVTPSSGFILEIDGQMKTRFESGRDARAEALQLKARFPMLQVKVYDAVEGTRMLISATADDPDDIAGSASNLRSRALSRGCHLSANPLG
jgi:hypothetical protein